MATLPDVDNMSRPSGFRSGRDVAPGASDYISPAIENFGGAVGQLADAYDRSAKADAAIAKAHAVAGYQVDAIKISDKYSIDKDSDYVTYGDRGAADLNAARNKWGDTITDPKAKAAFFDDISPDVARRGADLVNRGAAAGHDKNLADANVALDALARAAISSTDPAAVTKSIQEAHDLIDKLEANHTLTPAEAVKARQDQAARIAKLRYEADVVADPEGALKRLGVGQVPVKLNDRAQYTLDKFVAAGFTKEQAAGIVGNLLGESNLDPVGATGDGGAAHGIAQWREDRLEALKQFASARKKEWTDYDTQVDFVLHELATTESRTAAKLKAAKTVDEATAAFIGFERPRGWTDNNPRAGDNYAGRLNFANQVVGNTVAPDAVHDAPPNGVDPMLSPEDIITLRAQARAQLASQEQAARAAAAAAAADAKGFYGLRIQTGQLTNPNDFLNDPHMDDGDKATLMSSFNSKNADFAKTTNALGRVNDGAAFSPFNSDDRNDADRALTAIGGVGGLVDGDPNAAARLTHIVQKTGIVPESAMNAIRGAMSGPDPTKAANAYQVAGNLYAANSRIFDGLPGGDDVAKAAGAYNHLTQDFGKSGDAAAAQLQAAYSPENKRTADALKPAADDFVQHLDPGAIAGQFSGGFLGNLWGGSVSNGATPEQADVFAADVREIGRDEFIKAHGDPDVARAATVAQIKSLYSVSHTSGKPILMRNAPELRYPPINGNFDYLHDEAVAFASKVTGKAVGNLTDNGHLSDRESGIAGIALVATRATVQDFKTGNPAPQYDVVVWEWHDGQKRLADVVHGFSVSPGRQAELDQPRQAAAQAAHDQLGKTVAENNKLGLPNPSTFFPWLPGNSRAARAMFEREQRLNAAEAAKASAATGAAAAAPPVAAAAPAPAPVPALAAPVAVAPPAAAAAPTVTDYDFSPFGANAVSVQALVQSGMSASGRTAQEVLDDPQYRATIIDKGWSTGPQLDRILNTPRPTKTNKSARVIRNAKAK